MEEEGKVQGLPIPGHAHSVAPGHQKEAYPWSAWPVIICELGSVLKGKFIWINLPVSNQIIGLTG